MKRVLQITLLTALLCFTLFAATKNVDTDVFKNYGKENRGVADHLLPIRHSDIMSIDGWVEYERYYNEWDGSAWANEARYLYEYDKDANCVLLTYQEYKYSSYYQYYYYSTQGRTIYLYNSNGYLETVIDQDYDYGEWENSERWDYTYNSSGNLISLTSQYWTDDAWKNYWRYLYTYNTKQLVTEEIYQNWNAGTWENYYRNTYTYNTSNNKTLMIHQLWGNSSWENDSKEEYSYYGGYLKQKIDYYWYSGTWINHAKNLYTYDSKGNLTEDLIQWLTTDWNDARRYQYSYNSSNKITEKLYQTIESGSWVNNERHQYDYDSNGNQSEEIYQTWENNAWLNIMQWLIYNQEFSVPSISEVSQSPESPTDRDDLTITATVEDKSEDMTVECIYTFLGTTTVTPMVSGASDSYSLDLSAFGENGTFQYYIRAENNIGLKDSTNTFSVNISEYVEPTAPAITSLSYSPEDPTENDTVNINAIVTDNMGLSKVECIYIFNSVEYSRDMTPMNNGTDTYYLDIMPLGQTGNLDFYIRAENTQGLKDSTDVSTVNIIAGTSDITQLASEYYLCYAYPNPFNNTCTFEYDLPLSSHVDLDIIDFKGRTVMRLVNEFQEAGKYKIRQEFPDLVSGLYFYRLSTSDIQITKKMILLK